ncbi:MAG TPA: PilZ domain-containing protein [Blastocatellia bacterium]|nr:PilZ domain-containing protein [Blastocatellia bacterium]
MERRSIQRTKVDVIASILPADHARLLPCDVLDLSDRGARLDVGALAPQLGVPFDFSFDSFRTIRRARLVWCHGSIAGIQFVQP